MSQGMTTPPVTGYPVRLNVDYPEGLSRLLIFVKWLLVIPHLLIVYVLGYVNNVILLVAVFAILFTKKYPRGLFNFYVGVQRWTINTNAYMFFMRDEYPPFSWEAGLYPVHYEVDYPEQLRRFAPLYKWILALPHYVVLLILWVVWVFVLIISFFAILITGRYPRGLFDYTQGVFRWTYRVTAYVYLLRDEYPPFSLK